VAFCPADFDVKIKEIPCRKLLAEPRRAVLPLKRADFSNLTSGGAIERDAREMTTASGELDFQFQIHARLAFDQRLRFGARRATRPVGSRFEARQLACGSLVKVHFIGRRAS
jgi:hypothetical protein